MILKKYQCNRNNNDFSVTIEKIKIYIKVKGQWIYMCGVVDQKGIPLTFN